MVIYVLDIFKDAAGKDAVLGIAGAVEQPGDARLHHGAVAHHAGLERDVQLAAIQAVFGGFFPGPAHGHDLGMGAGIVLPDRFVVAAADDLPFPDQHGAYRHFAPRFGPDGLEQRFFHEVNLVFFHGV
ncbi:MAG: hypothetical protein NTW95_03935 [Candidatus Aminicenantes bacterium]|nr:hypothetical protein [Candidatus Aminicenantes bacterium]